jgi:4-oxalocrotonate tautomerase
MPVVHIEMLSGRTREQKMELAAAVTRDVSEIAKCMPESVQIIFSEVDRDDWATGGRLASDPQKQD